jgi:hypothetical protein
MDWSPIIETVMRPFELGTPTKVKFLDESSDESLSALGWTDANSRGSATLEEDADPTFNDLFRTNKLSANIKLMQMNMKALERRLAKGLVSHEGALGSLENQIHDTRVQVGKDPV